ncbi:hypothetical protein Catovirus_1_764 [Catovirus CTV1]|uniref:Leucine-rich repeat protein n=1 Tax=Catovirus CTV1 TaxID=1977631 RepID=A0A1V0SAL6_9VIRU|nr:hypothetical protein Catovirus_1_764 [Catovirus CTV1]
MIIDILNIINSFLYVKDQYKLKLLNKFVNDNLLLYFGRQNNKKSTKLITEGFLKNNQNIVELYLTDNIVINNLNFMTKLRYLKIDGLCHVDCLSINELRKIYFLDLSYNIYLTKLPPSDIKILRLVGNDKITDEDIKHLDLFELNCSFNYKIKKISNFRNLKKLIIQFRSSIDEEEINKCPNIEYLDITANKDINLDLIHNKNLFIKK